MSKQLKKQWVAALRSGKYMQTTGYLKKKEEDGKCAYCCLGVLCSVAGLRLKKKSSNGFFGHLDEWGLPEEDGITHVPNEHGERIGLPKKVQDRLMRMNDSRGKTFKQIATYIEKSKSI